MEFACIEADTDARGVIPFTLYEYQRKFVTLLLTRQSLMVLKRRQIGITWVMAAYILWTAAYHKSAHVAVFSAGEEAVKEVLRKVEFIHDHLPKQWQRLHKGVLKISFRKSGSYIQGFPSTKHAGVGNTHAVVFTDEAARHPYASENFADYSPTMANGQWVCASTSNPELGPSGFFYDMWTAAEEAEYRHKHEAGPPPEYQPIFLGVSEARRPGQDEAWFDRERERLRGDPTAYDSNYPETPAQAFQGKEGLALPEFTPMRHVRLDHPMHWEDFDFRFAGIDPGGGDPTAIIPIGVWRDARSGMVRYHQPEEGYWKKPIGLDEYIQYLSRLHSRAPFDRIWIDVAGSNSVLVKTLQAYGFPVEAAIKDRKTGMTLYREILADGRLTHHVSATETIREYAGYRLAQRRDPNSHERYTTSTPVDNHADAKDAMRYALVGATRLLRWSANSTKSAPKFVYS